MISKSLARIFKIKGAKKNLFSTVCLLLLSCASSSSNLTDSRNYTNCSLVLISGHKMITNKVKSGTIPRKIVQITTIDTVSGH